MNKEEHNQLLNSLRDLNNSPDVAEIVNTLEQDYTSVLNNIDELKTSIETVTEERDKYANLNNKLWLENQTHKPPDEKEENVENVNNDNNLSYDDLINKLD